MVAKLDLGKAHARIDWKFLKKILKQVGFQAHLVNLIMHCTTTGRQVTLCHPNLLYFA